MKLAKRFILMAKSHWGEIIITVISLIGVSALSLVTPEIIRRMTAVLSNPELLSAEILFKYALILVLAYLVRGVLRFVSMYVRTWQTGLFLVRKCPEWVVQWTFW